MANNKVKAPTEEQIKQQRVRALLQQRAAVAQGALYNILQKEGMSKDPQEVAEYVIALADEFMDAIYAPESKQAEGE